ncbi:MAG: marine proteobacterial sortase target protein [Thermoanaerobaculia bacterium]
MTKCPPAANPFSPTRTHAVPLAFAVALVAFALALPCRSEAPPNPGHGSLLVRSPGGTGFSEIPLKRTEVAIDVTGLVASTSVIQRFSNEASEPVEAIYVFPLPHDAALYDMEIRVGNRVIKSVVKEREEARRVYEQARAEGRHAALVDEERPNIFTAKVANLMPKDEIEVRLRYVQSLVWDAGTLRLVFPTVVGPRFIPGDQAVGHQGTGESPDTNVTKDTNVTNDTSIVPDASKITPPVRVRASSVEVRPDLVIEVSLNVGIPLASISSPSHPIAIATGASNTSTVTLETGTTIPNKDFVLALRRADDAEPIASLFVSKREGDEDASFMLIAFPPTARTSTERAPLEMLYLIDISGSMQGNSIVQAKEALLQALERLRPGDRFNIVAFDDRYLVLDEEPFAATAPRIEEGRKFVRSLQSRGGTMMLPALEHVMAMPQLPGSTRDIVVLTDGDLGNEEQIFTSLRKNLGDARLFTVAIGSAPNHFLATKMAQFGRGTFTQIASAAEITDQMAKLLGQIESPVLSDLKVSVSGAEVLDLVPGRIPDLFRGQPLVVFGRLKGSGGGATLTLSGSDAGRSFKKDLPIRLDAAAFHPGITTLWARKRVDEHLDAFRSAAESERAAIRMTIVDMALRYNLVTRFTSRVAVEDIIVNPGGEAKTSTVPTELPEGWSAARVLGENPKTGGPDDFLSRLGLVLLAFFLPLFLVAWRPLLPARVSRVSRVSRAAR